MLKYLIQFQELMRQSLQNGMENVSAYVDQTKLFVIINKNGIKINVDVSAKN